jgi:hypothetical protein
MHDICLGYPKLDLTVKFIRAYWKDITWLESHVSQRNGERIPLGIPALN